MPSISINPEVHEALRSGRPVVALETAVLTHGLPRTPLPASPPDDATGWARDGATNLEVMRAMQRAVRDGGAVPAAVAVIDSTLHVGASAEALERLAMNTDAGKAGAATLAGALASGTSAGTTVSATLAACAMTGSPAIPIPAIPIPPVRVLATGGIGGVHPGWRELPDISTDLALLHETPVCVVCAGAKSILDLRATSEALETLGVPVIGYGTDHLPAFHARGTAELAVHQRVDDPGEAAELCRAHWDVLGRRTAVILAAPPPEEYAVDHVVLDEANRKANDTADRQGVEGPARTPFVLEEVARLTAGKSLVANVALLVNNARIGAAVAAALCERPPA